MHILFFGLKRAFHGSLRVTRRALATLGLTPARFDMLYIVAKEGSSLLQRELQRALGVAAATVSRMLSSLEELGLVEREVSEEDHRCQNVVLTKAGRRCVLRAARLLIHTGHIQLMVDSALSPDVGTTRPRVGGSTTNSVACSSFCATRTATWRRSTIRSPTPWTASPAHSSGTRSASRLPDATRFANTLRGPSPRCSLRRDQSIALTSSNATLDTVSWERGSWPPIAK
jgi:DNA-binding MarR family transcriptional regulator